MTVLNLKLGSLKMLRQNCFDENLDSQLDTYLEVFTINKIKEIVPFSMSSEKPK